MRSSKRPTTPLLPGEKQRQSTTCGRPISPMSTAQATTYQQLRDDLTASKFTTPAEQLPRVPDRERAGNIVVTSALVPLLCLEAVTTAAR